MRQEERKTLRLRGETQRDEEKYKSRWIEDRRETDRRDRDRQGSYVNENSQGL